MRRSSSSVKGGLESAPRFFRSCAAELAPTMTLVTCLRESIQASDISARDCPREAASSFSALICDSFSAVSADSLREPPSDILEPAGIPFR